MSGINNVGGAGSGGMEFNPQKKKPYGGPNQKKKRKTPMKPPEDEVKKSETELRELQEEHWRQLRITLDRTDSNPFEREA